jgi:hypothetical protein
MSPYERIPAEEAPPSPETNHNTNPQPGINAAESVPNPTVPSESSGPNSNSNTNSTRTIPTNEYIAPSTQPLTSSNTTPTTVQSDIESGTPTDNDSDTDSNTHLEEAMLHATHESTIASLMVEREYNRRGSSVCVVILILVLFRLWLEALFEGDVALMIISSMMTVYIYAWRRHRELMEESLTMQIEQEQERMRESGEETGIEVGNVRHEEEDHDGDGAESRAERRRRRRARRDLMANINDFEGLHNFMVRNNEDHVDLEMLGFQAQLAFAIMESQRHIIQTGGYGRPDDDGANETRGVSDAVKAAWRSFEYDVNDPIVQKCEDLKPHKNEDPSCCICLCEYEEKETLIQLNCGHVYHKSCIDSWCQNHTRCPLCNQDLEPQEDTSSGSIV